jgi:hypothetical protein
VASELTKLMIEQEREWARPFYTPPAFQVPRCQIPGCERPAECPWCVECNRHCGYPECYKHPQVLVEGYNA